MSLAKWVLPTFAFGFVTVVMAFKEAHKVKPDFPVLVSVLAVLAVILVVVFKKSIWVLADEVLDGGDYLLVRFGKKQQHVSISNVANVDVENQLGATTVRLQLSVPCEFGSVITFLAKSTSRNPFQPSAVAADLAARSTRGKQ
jgi:hypothetical protein